MGFEFLLLSKLQEEYCSDIVLFDQCSLVITINVRNANDACLHMLLIIKSQTFYGSEGN